MSDLVIGIDLGTTNSCVAVFMNGRMKILEDNSGVRIVPSFIFFNADGSVFIGEHAKSKATDAPMNGIYEMKRLVGRKYDDSVLQKSLKYFPFDVSADSSNNLIVSFKQKGVSITKTSQQLYTTLLKELKNYTKKKLGEAVNKVVITVLAYFNVTQREVTLAAAKDAGFTALKLLNEPTAAALAYYHDHDIQETHRSLVYDLGGGTFDVAILEKRSDGIDVICVAGDTQLGGHDLDNCILEYVCQQLRNKYGYDASRKPDDKRRLRNKCEKAKKKLSISNEACITINGMVPNVQVKISLTRKEFEKMAYKFFQRTTEILDKCLKDSGFRKISIQEVILCGGSTRIPKIQELLSDYFDGKQLNKFANPDECVAEGAALQAAMLSTSTRQHIGQLKMVDVVPLSIGFDNHCRKMIFIIKRGSKLPASASHTYVNVEANQTAMECRIYEGERLDARKNRHLGSISINNITPAPPRQVEVVYNYLEY
ncbi:heat shock 70 kDa protein-like [Zophobas morio]|uniref:heat shock 70 kDa protein-like n=1 Tax=Zophobas morio TaxID=2755281 RepID=UPI003082F1D8